MSTPKFSKVSGSFHSDLRNRIKEYFDASGKNRTGNIGLFFKAILLVVVFLAIYIHLVFFTPIVPLALLECAGLGMIVAAIGFNIMHDGAHGSFSKYSWVNQVAAFSLNILGGNSFMWNMKHNVVHHAYTNIDGYDDDIDIQPWLRMSYTQRRYRLHKFQHIYFWVLYCFLYMLWVFILDYRKYFASRMGEVPMQRMTLKDHIVFWSFKALNAYLFIVLPILHVGFWPWVIGYVVFSTVAGFILSIVFQLAHTVTQTEFPTVDPSTGNLKDEWAIHQIKTTANFATKNRVVSWLVGGLNFQIEHHLFPKISHVHYPQISAIIRKTCEEYGLTYIEYPRVRLAVASHVAFLKGLGRS